MALGAFNFQLRKIFKVHKLTHSFNFNLRKHQETSWDCAGPTLFNFVQLCSNLLIFAQLCSTSLNFINFDHMCFVFLLGARLLNLRPFFNDLRNTCASLLGPFKIISDLEILNGQSSFITITFLLHTHNNYAS